MIITLGGLSGSGKSTVKRLLGERLGWKTYSVGDMRERYAQEHNLTLEELNARDMIDGRGDRLVDAFQKELGEKEDSFIIDGWLSWFFIPKSFKVFLTINEKEAARRIFQAHQEHPDERKDETRTNSVEELQDLLHERLLQNKDRYQKWYRVNFLDSAHYDLVLDTTEKTPAEVVDEILRHIPR